VFQNRPLCQSCGNKFYQKLYQNIIENNKNDSISQIFENRWGPELGYYNFCNLIEELTETVKTEPQTKPVFKKNA